MCHYVAEYTWHIVYVPGASKLNGADTYTCSSVGPYKTCGMLINVMGFGFALEHRGELGTRVENLYTTVRVYTAARRAGWWRGG